MAPRKPQRVRFVKQYTDEFGVTFRRYRAPDGREVSICTLLGRSRCSTATARAAAVAKLYPARRARGR